MTEISNKTNNRQMEKIISKLSISSCCPLRSLDDEDAALHVKRHATPTCLILAF